MTRNHDIADQLHQADAEINAATTTGEVFAIVRKCRTLPTEAFGEVVDWANERDAAIRAKYIDHGRNSREKTDD